MGLNIGTFNNSIIDAQALTRVTEKIFAPEKQNTVDVSKLDLSKFNRVSLGTDFYAARTNTETAIRASKAATDFDVNLSKAFSANVQYLNSAAAQSLFTSKENTGKIVINVENAQKVDSDIALRASSNIEQTTNLNKERRGSNPFSFYINTNKKANNEDAETVDVQSYSPLNFFA